VKNLLRSSIVAATIISGAGASIATETPLNIEQKTGTSRASERMDHEWDEQDQTQFRVRRSAKRDNREARDEYRQKPTRFSHKRDTGQEGYWG
jgi:hypothetical protein